MADGATINDDGDEINRTVHPGHDSLFGITCLLSANIMDTSGISRNYLLACDSMGVLHFTQNGLLINSKPLPCVVNDVSRGDKLRLIIM